MPYADGTYSTPIQIGPRRYRRPFVSAPSQDIYACIIERDYVVSIGDYSPTAQTRENVTNLLTYSEAFDNVAWAKSGASVTQGSVAGPAASTLDASTVTDTTGAFEGAIEQVITVANDSTTKAVSLFVKAGTSASSTLYATFTGGTGVVAQADLTWSTMAVVSTGTTATLHAVGNGWYLLSFTITNNSTGNTSLTMRFYPSLSAPTQGSVYIFGAQITAASYPTTYVKTTTASATISSPPTDYSQNRLTDSFADPFAFLCDETGFSRFGAGAYDQFTRKYARIPNSQTIYQSSRYIALPVPTNTYNGLSSLVAFDFQYNQTLGEGHYEGNVIYTERDYALYRAKPATYCVAGRATAGTFTITYGANTTAAIAYNDSGANIATTINGLASVSGDSLTVTVTNNLTTGGTLTINITIGGSIPSGWPKRFTMNAAGLTLTTSTNPTTSVITGNQQVIYLPDHVGMPSHGMNVSRALAGIVSTTNRAISMPNGYWGNVDVNTLWLPTANGNWVAAGDYARVYSPSTRLMRAKVVESFYLPGVTANINTAADITVSNGLQNPSAFLNALASLTGWQIYDTDGPAQWEGPTYQVNTQYINLDDVAS